MKHRWGHVALLLVLVALAKTTSAAYWTAYYDPNTNLYSVSPIHDPVNGVATGEFEDERNATGWSRLSITTNPVYEDSIAMRAAGYLEGVVTAPLVWENWYNNVWSSYGIGNVPTGLAGWLKANMAYTMEKARVNAATQPYWRHVQLMLVQLRGLHEGYTSVYSNTSARALSFEDFVFLNSNGDSEELCTVTNCPSAPSLSSRKNAPTITNTHCSAFVRLTPDLSELYAGHTTWDTYASMVRMFKQYTFRLKAQQTTAQTTLFSSYPGYISSVDDFYQLSSNLVVLETTNGITSPALLRLIRPNTVLSWLRVSIANRMASSGREWIEVFTRENSGTYNNQWIVVDYNRFNPGQPLQDGLLMIAEQIPEWVESEDVTPYLRLGYWPSYNIPFFERIFNESGFVELERKYGDWFNYMMHPRAYIFRRNATQVEDLADARRLIRYNDWQHDPAAYNNPGNQISSRFDLVPQGENPPNPNLARAAFGGIDSKMTSSALVRLGRCQAQSGPSHDQQTPFAWVDGEWPGVYRMGQPTLWNFGWVEMPSGRSVD